MISQSVVRVIFSGVGKDPIEGFACEDCHLIRWHSDCCRCSIMVNVQWSMLNETYQVVIAAGSHLFPFRTEKLSPLAPMVLQCNAGE